MFDSISFNKKQAVAADAPRSISINGAYTGVITQAEIYASQKNATMVEFAFKGDDGSLTFLSLCLKTSDGKETFNMGFFQALLGILGLDNVVPAAGKVFNKDGTPRDGWRIPAVEKKRIGFLLQRQNDIYQEQDGSWKEFYRMNIASVFDAVSGQTFHEKSAGAPAKMIEQRAAKLQDVDSKRLKEYKADLHGMEQAVSGTAAPSIDNFGEDVPF